MESRGLSPKTVAAYMSDLVLALGSTAPDRLSLEATLARSRESGASPKTIARRLTAVRSFFRWMRETGYAGADPTEGLRVKQTTQFVPAFLTEDETARLLRTIKTSGDRNKTRDLAMILLMLERGLRVSEVAGIDFSDIAEDGDHMAVVVNEKGLKRSKKALGPMARAGLRAHMLSRVYAENEASPDEKKVSLVGPVFLSAENSRISIGQIENRVKKWVMAAGIEKNVTPHSLRHTFATKMFKDSNNIVLLQMALGHASITTTMRYVHPMNDDLEKALGA